MIMTDTSVVEKKETKIHKLAAVEPGAQLGEGVEIGAFAYVGPNVKIGDGTVVGPNTQIEGNTEIGKNCKFLGCSIGAPPQDISYQGEDTKVIIGDNTTIREYATVHKAAKEGETRIGSGCFLMNYVHIGHNVQLGDNVIMANAAMLPGYVEVGDNVFISGLTTIHQHCRIGRNAIVGAMTGSRLDIPPYLVCEGRPARARAVNKIGLRRGKVKREIINELDKAFKFIYRSELNLSDALSKIESELEQFEEIKNFVEFYRTSKRGVTLPTTSANSMGELDQ